jgi:Na+-driven multidrug efflux pump
VRFNKEILIRIRNFLPDLSLIKEILTISIPAILMQAIGTVMTLSMNNILLGFERIGEGIGKNALNVFTVYFKLQSFVFMPIFGLNSGMVPILSYNYGANRPKRVFSTMRVAYITAISYVLVCLCAFQFMPDLLLSIFNASDAMLEIGRGALKTISLSFVFAGFSIISISACQALGKSIYSLFVSIGRQLVVLIPAAYLLSLTDNVSLVWWAFPIAEVISMVVSVVFFVQTYKCIIAKIPE